MKYWRWERPGNEAMTSYQIINAAVQLYSEVGPRTQACVTGPSPIMGGDPLLSWVGSEHKTMITAPHRTSHVTQGPFT